MGKEFFNNHTQINLMNPTTSNYFIRISRGKWETKDLEIDNRKFTYAGYMHHEKPSGTGTITKINTQQFPEKTIISYISIKGFCKSYNILPGKALFSIASPIIGYRYRKEITIESKERITEVMDKHLAYWKEERALVKLQSKKD